MLTSDLQPTPLACSEASAGAVMGWQVRQKSAARAAAVGRSGERGSGCHCAANCL